MNLTSHSLSPFNFLANLVLQIHQAYFGAVNGTSHGQLASSLADKHLRSFLAGFTDRPGVPPAGYVLQPYLAATSFENYYLVCRTWPDTAVERQGMVFTHVLMLPLQQLAEVSELGTILNLLLSDPPSLAERSIALAPLTLDVPGVSPIDLGSEVPVSWLAVIKHLVDTPELTSVYTLGEAVCFQALLEALWHGLPVSLRAKLSWGIRFAPPGRKDITPLLVYVPAELEVKWRGEEVIQLATDEMNVPELPVDQLIFSRTHGVIFYEFLVAIEVSPQSFATLKRCQRAFQQYENLLAGTADVGELLALVRTIRQLQPDPDKARIIKSQAIEALTAGLLAGGVTEALALRAVPMDPFHTGIERLGYAVGIIVQNTFITANPDPTLQGNLLKYLAEPNPAIIEKWWRKAATASFTLTLAEGSESAAKAIWLGLSGAENVYTYVLTIIPHSSLWEQVLIKTVPPSLPVEVAEAVANFSDKRNWWGLFAASVGAAHAPAEALRKLVTAEKRLDIPVSPRVSELAKRVADVELIELAVELQNHQLEELAGEACARNPKLLASIDVIEQSWRTIWSISLSYSKSITVGLSKPTETINTFLGEVANGRAIDIQPLELIADSTYANVLHLPDRTALWDKLPIKLQPKFAAATLDELVEEILANNWDGAIEPILTKRAQSIDFIGKFLGLKRNDPVAVLTANSFLNNLTDNYLKDYISHLDTIDGIVASHLGKLVSNKRWALSANAILSKAKHNANFSLALSECSNMFSGLDRLIYHKLFGHQVTSDDAWNALENLMIALYEEGPSQGHIWKKAGGDVTKFTNTQTRRAQWESAIALLRDGGGGKDISAETLIHSALRDFKNNPNLQALANSQHLFKL